MKVFVSNSTTGVRSGKLFGCVDTPCWSPLVNLHLPNGLMYTEFGQQMAPLLLTSNLTINYNQITDVIEITDSRITNNIKKVILKDDFDDIYIIIKCNDEFLQLITNGTVDNGINIVDCAPDSISKRVIKLGINEQHDEINGDHAKTSNKHGFRWLLKRDKYDLKDFKHLPIACKSYLRYVKKKRDLFTVSRENMDNIEGFEYKIAQNAPKEYIHMLINVLPNNKLKLIHLDDGRYKNVLYITSCGFDVIISDYPSKLSEMGLALLPYNYYASGSKCNADIVMESGDNERENSFTEIVDEYVINLRGETYANDYSNKITQYSPREETRGYIHHLLKCNETLATVLLQIHNNYMYAHFFQSLRESIEGHKFEEFISNFK
ncbi:Queuine tRNA-ribosyltransferase [Babesia microti strain RI]|uniref:Queuine tRNA-ribosyltransferase n=1 Tax=Babesia microti (strain RI) TaxID=1133968 RepID=I7IH72_BABMR|nr:Queuine tRNA-ribosyltransferase [Babesia microti strain RI]CCF75307.1 Queuine tRNA-ribosyltransferase [Babesia microti strain RI]|eukprot:XP_012649715.1 Queuine tRNA-ribosyltransferase [Babesia microti strain RI]